MNDEQRRQWILNDEGLYDLFRSSCTKSISKWIRDNRKMLDELIAPVLNGTKSAHHLKYG